MPAELAFHAERLHSLLVPVREEREVQVERLRPGDVGPLGIARDAKRPDARLAELRPRLLKLQLGGLTDPN